jgi:hypothetical protein
MLIVPALLQKCNSIFCQTFGAVWISFWWAAAFFGEEMVPGKGGGLPFFISQKKQAPAFGWGQNRFAGEDNAAPLKGSGEHQYP